LIGVGAVAVLLPVDLGVVGADGFVGKVVAVELVVRRI
jgi:short subunit dehydrogenase-like uncharacterized protein